MSACKDQQRYFIQKTTSKARKLSVEIFIETTLISAVDKTPRIFVSMMTETWNTVKIVVQKVRKGTILNLSKRQGRETEGSLIKSLNPELRQHKKT